MEVNQLSMSAFSLRFTKFVWLLERVILQEISERKKEEQRLSHNVSVCSTICSYYVQNNFVVLDIRFVQLYHTAQQQKKEQ